MVVRGVPHRIAQDAWWLDDADPPRGLRAAPLLVPALFLTDFLIWGVRPGLGIAIWMLAIAGTVVLTLFRRLDRARLAKAVGVLLLAVLPLVEVVQFGTFMIALLGLSAFSIMITADQWDVALWRAVARLPFYGLVQTMRDAFALRVSAPSKGSLRAVLFDWALPVVAGGVFVVLFVAANPLLDRWVLSLTDFETDILPGWGRFFFWSFMAVAIWPLLRLTTMIPALTKARQSRLGRFRSGLLNERSVSRALVVFNMIFLVQTLLDMGYLWGGVALPEGLTYAQYAHRGAYPLLGTALLAGVFALLAQPYLGTGAGVRRLLYLWIAQTVVLVVSSILRLDLYVDVYGLTRLRFAAFVWMIVVALGLVLISMQMAGRQTVAWFLRRAFGLGLLAIYVCNLTNIDGFIARHNISVGKGYGYLCRLGEGAVPALHASEVVAEAGICYSHMPRLSQRDDWREWGYRNARLHRSLAAMEDAQ